MNNRGAIPFEYVLYRPGDAAISFADNIMELGWTGQYDLEDTIMIVGAGNSRILTVSDLENGTKVEEARLAF